MRPHISASQADHRIICILQSGIQSWAAIILLCFWANQMRQYDRCNQCRLSVLSHNDKACAAGSLQVVIDFQNKPLLEFHQLNQLTNLSAPWDFAVRPNEGANLFASRRAAFTFRSVIFDN